MREKKIFRFKQFSVRHEQAAMKVGTDGVLLGAWVDVSGAKRILDIGTGTGLIALMLAQHTSKETKIDAIEIEQHAYEEACSNVAQSPWQNRITVHHQSLQEHTGGPYDLIVCNPPFFQNSMKPPSEKRGLARHADSLPMQALAFHARRLLDDSGTISLVIPFADHVKISRVFLQENLHCTRRTTIRTTPKKKPERCLLNFSTNRIEEKSNELVLLDNDGNRSMEYAQLTKDFYLKL